MKHFAGYSQSINGHDRVEAQLPIRYLQDTLLPSYAGGIDAGAATVMVDSGSVNDIPARVPLPADRGAAQPARLQGRGDQRLRRRHALQTAYHVAADLPEAVAKAVNAGVDVSMMPSDYRRLEQRPVQDVRQGVVPARIDQAVRGSYAEVRARPVRPPLRRPRAKADAAVTANRDLARRAARRVDHAAAQPGRRPAALDRPWQARRHRPERGLGERGRLPEPTSSAAGA